MQLSTYRQLNDITTIEQGERVAKATTDQWIVGISWWLHNNLHYLRTMTTKSGKAFAWVCECGFAEKIS